MPNIRLMPHGAGKVTTMTANGRLYSCALGATIDVPDFDAQVLTANHWVRVAEVGTTAQRPATPALHMQFYDTTISALITFDGVVWRGPTGTAV
jgi:hypothetical protein